MGPHQPGDLVPTDVEPGPAGRVPELANPVDPVVLVPDVDQRGAQLGVTDRPG